MQLATTTSAKYYKKIVEVRNGENPASIGKFELKGLLGSLEFSCNFSKSLWDTQTK